MIKSKINSPAIVTDYPWIGVTQDGLAVLFAAHGKGIALNRPNDDCCHQVGYTRCNWDMSCFDALRGEIVLSNK